MKRIPNESRGSRPSFSLGHLDGHSLRSSNSAFLKFVLISSDERLFRHSDLCEVVYYTFVAIDLKLVVLPLKFDLLKHSLGQFIIGHAFTKAQWIR